MEQTPITITITRESSIPHANLVNNSNEILQILTCKVCLKLMSAPINLAACGHSYCHRCYVGIKTSGRKCGQCNNTDMTAAPQFEMKQLCEIIGKNYSYYHAKEYPRTFLENCRTRGGDHPPVQWDTQGVFYFPIEEIIESRGTGEGTEYRVVRENNLVEWVPRKVIRHPRYQELLENWKRRENRRRTEGDVCNVTYLKLAYKLDRHMQTHNESREVFECKYCKQKLARSDDLKRHEQTHLSRQRKDIDPTTLLSGDYFNEDGLAIRDEYNAIKDMDTSVERIYDYLLLDPTNLTILHQGF